MGTYYFSFRIDGFDNPGQEHRLRHVDNLCPISCGLERAVTELVRWIAKMTNSEADHLAAKRIILKSAWYDGGVKKVRITTKEFTEAMLAGGFLNPKGREEGRIKNLPMTFKTPVFQKHKRRGFRR